jgi:hypothetical protein
MRAKHWFECWGGPILVVTIVLVGTLLATLVLRELLPCGWLDIALRGGDCPCSDAGFAGLSLEASQSVP